MRKIVNFLAIAFIFAALGVAFWFGGRTYILYSGPSERLLSQTGYQRHVGELSPVDGVYRFAPKYPFWSDGANKKRSIFIPSDSKIDTSNPDRWNFPKGTRIWKDFEQDSVLVETRMLLKYGEDPWEWDMAAYLWRDDYTDADKLKLGKTNVRATEHDIPSPSQCLSCHSSGENRRPLGITAVQLPWEDDELLSLSELIRRDKLTNPPLTPYVIPGNNITKRALGYLDTNCGSCHYEGSTFVEKEIQLRLNLTTKTLSNVSDTNVIRTAVQLEPNFGGLNTSVYIEPGDPLASLIYKRMTIRGNVWQMPPIATEEVDTEGVELIGQWIDQLDQEKGGN